MKFLIDADVAIEVTRALRNARHEVDSVIELLGAETEDADIWDHAARTGKIVITCNRDDFLRLAGTDPKAGLIILNRKRTRQAECKNVLALVARAGESGLSGNINFA